MNRDSLPALIRRSLPEECLSDLVLDRLRCGEMPALVAQAAERHLLECERCRGRAAQQAAAAEELSGALPPLYALLGERTFLAAVAPPVSDMAPSDSAANDTGLIEAALSDGRTRRQPSNVTSFRRPPWWAPAVAVLSAAAALALFLGRPAEPEGDIRLKGLSGELDVFVKRAGKVFRWQAEPLRPGDQLRYSFRAPEPLHVMVLSRETSGAVNQYFPAEPRSFAVDQGVTLSKGATELDATLGRETLWAIFCQKPFTADTLFGQLRQSGGIAPTQGCATQRLEFTKEAP